MRHRVSTLFPLLGMVWSVLGAGTCYEVVYPPSEAQGELRLGVTYTLWVPEEVKALRGIIVHQHGCGAGACQGGGTAAFDLHWQALAKKWNCALLGPSYQQADSQDCTWWSNPSNGSEKTFLNALTDLAAKSAHPELTVVPWCLWGHSGGGYWAGEMQIKYPHRIVAVWQRSGAARFFREKDPERIAQAVYDVPVMCNPGVKEKTDRFARIWDGMVDLTRTFRAKNAPVCLAPDPRTSHECGDSRYLSIPFFDACLEMRLPKRIGGELRPVDMREGWFAPILGSNAIPAGEFRGDVHACSWLPNQKVARAWEQYVSTGAVTDSTPPPKPLYLRAAWDSDGAVELTWDAEADFESGLQAFVIFRDGIQLAKVPEQPIGRFGRALFQTMSYHDTPEKPLPEMKFRDRAPIGGRKQRYDVLAVNSVGLRSKPVGVTVEAHGKQAGAQRAGRLTN